MCGIAGIVECSGRPVSTQSVETMCSALRHRGPDDEGVVDVGSKSGAERKASVVLGNRRLSVIDVDGGHQPISNEDGTVWTVLNGEIYNYRELRKTLEEAGHCFATGSDTEVIVHAYEMYGDEFVEHLDGMFAIAIWDTRQQQLLLVRDRFGKKPLLYAQRDSWCAFASELQALLVLPEIQRDIDPAAVGSYLSYMAVPAPQTIYRSIRKLPPAHVLILKDGCASLRRYWQLSFVPKQDISDVEAAECSVELLRDAVRKRLVSDVPIGAFLSGGVDSSAVVAFMAKEMGRPVKTFSIGFEEEKFNELEYARSVAQDLGTEHSEFLVKPDALEVLPELVAGFGEPFGDMSAVPTYYVSKMAKESVTVCLSGDGGDEVFAGYSRYLRWLRSRLLDIVPTKARRILLGNFSTLLPDFMPGKGLVHRCSLAPLDRYGALLYPLAMQEKSRLLSPDVRRIAEGEAPYAGLKTLWDSPNKGALARLQWVDLHTYLPDDVLCKVDRASMLNSLEVRVPLLDHELVERALQIPENMRIRNGKVKYLFKQMLSPHLSKSILARRKMGFGLPSGSWFRSSVREYARDLLLGPDARTREFLNTIEVNALIETHQKGFRDMSGRIWALLVLEIWCRRFG